MIPQGSLAPALAGEPVLYALVEAELARFGEIAVSRRLGRWGTTIAKKRGTAAIDAGWLLLDFSPSRGRARSPEVLLERNAALHWNAKYVLSPAGTVRLRSEIPLEGIPIEGPPGLALYIRTSLGGLGHALGARAAPPSHAPRRAGVAPPALSALCSAAGWPFSERANGRVYVDLEVPDGAVYQTSAERRENRIELWADPSRGEQPCDETSRLAVAALLLSAAGVVRLTSAVSRRSNSAHGPDCELGFRAVLPASASAILLAHALSSLSVALEICGREIRALSADSELARMFLEVRHPRWAMRQQDCLAQVESPRPSSAPAPRSAV